LRIFDAGAFVFMSKGNLRGFSSPTEWEEVAISLHAIDLPGLSGVFCLWLCGSLVACIVFVIEAVKVKLCCEAK